MATKASVFIYILQSISSSLIYAQQPLINCDDSTGSCVVSCDISYKNNSNDACAHFDLTKQFIMDNLENDNQYISNLTSLSLECTGIDSCLDVMLDCDEFGVENCTIACFEDDACEKVKLSCSGNNIKQCYIYTKIHDSAMSNSLIDCAYPILSESTHFCGYKCGEEDDGCYQNNTCLDHGYSTKCSCEGINNACEHPSIVYKTNIITTQFVTTVSTDDDKNWLEKILANTTDDVLIFGGIGLGIICLICFILCCVCGYRIKNGKIQKVAKEYKVENKTLNSGLLKNDALATNGDGNKNGKTKNGSNKASVDKQQTAVSYDDNAELGSFKMIPDAELGDGLFNSVVVDDDDDY